MDIFDIKCILKQISEWVYFEVQYTIEDNFFKSCHNNLLFEKGIFVNSPFVPLVA